MLKKILLLAIVIVMSINAQTQINSQKKEKIEKLLELTGSLKMGATFGKVMVNQMYQTYRNMGTTIPDSILVIMEKEISTLIDNEMRLKSGLVDQLCGIYDKYYSEKNIDDMIAFYNTETGKKLIATLPEVMQESMTIGQQWGLQKGQELVKALIERMKAKGVILPQI